MDVSHVAFASLRKYDGKRQRRLTIAEMAQIAGRAGRHQRDGTFGTLSFEGSRGAAFEEEEVQAIEEHRFPPLERLYWREGQPDTTSVDSLIADLERRPDAAGAARGTRSDRPVGVEAAGRRTLGARPGARRADGAAFMVCLRAARFPQDRGRSAQPAWSGGSIAT